MTEKNFLTAEEVAEEMICSTSKAYDVIRKLNRELQEMGYLTLTGRVNTAFFKKRVCYNE